MTGMLSVFVTGPGNQHTGNQKETLTGKKKGNQFTELVKMFKFRKFKAGKST